MVVVVAVTLGEGRRRGLALRELVRRAVCGLAAAGGAPPLGAVAERLQGGSTPSPPVESAGSWRSLPFQGQGLARGSPAPPPVGLPRGPASRVR